MKTLDILKELKAKIISNDTARVFTGICGYLYSRDYIDDSIKLENYFKKWPHFSGSLRYPIPGIYYNNKDPEFAYNKIKYKNFYNINHPYGAMRINLLDFLISELEKENADQIRSEA